MLPLSNRRKGSISANDDLRPDDLLPITGVIVYLVYRNKVRYLVSGKEPVVTLRDIQDTLYLDSKDVPQEENEDVYEYTHSNLALELVLHDISDDVNGYLQKVSRDPNKRQILMDILGEAIEIAGRNKFSGRITPDKTAMANYQKIDSFNRKYLQQTLDDGMTMPDTMIFVGGLGYVGRVWEAINGSAERKKVGQKIKFENKHIVEAKILFGVDIADKNKRYAALKDPAVLDWMDRFF